ncbi:MAG: tetratricopeptide repeat protein [Fimbriiglobus sp.]
MLRHSFHILLVLLGLTTLMAMARDEKPNEEALEKTISELNKLSSLDALNGKLREFNKDKPKSKQLVEFAAKKLKAAGNDEKPIKFNTALLLGRLALNVKDTKAATGFYGFCYDEGEKLQSFKKMMDAYDPLMDIYWLKKEFDKAEELTKRTLESGGNDAEQLQEYFVEKLIMTKAKAGDTDEALRMAENLVKLSKGNWYFQKLKGDVYLEADKLDEATSTYETTIEKMEKDLAAAKKGKGERNVALAEELTRQTKTMKYMLTSVYVDNGEVDKCVALLEKLIKEDPDRATYYNDLGFILADHDKRLEESEKFVRKALELDAADRKKLLKEEKITEEIAKEENAAYLDSLGWVLYKRGKYEEALKYLKKSSEDPDQGNHIEIFDHVADCLVKLDRKKEAIEMWEKALKLEDVSKRDIERRKKVIAKLKKLRAEIEK